MLIPTGFVCQSSGKTIDIFEQQNCGRSNVLAGKRVQATIYPKKKYHLIICPDIKIKIYI
jgi:hypothetical protein